MTYDRMKWIDSQISEQGEKITEWWKSKSPFLGWYDYIYGTPYLVPRVYFHEMADYYRFGYRNGVRAMYAEAYPNWGEGPKLYVALKLQWNPARNVDDLLRDWYVSAVGPDAAPDLEAYYSHWEKFWTERVIASNWFRRSIQYLDFSDPAYLDVVTFEDIAKIRKLLESVFAQAQKPKQRARAELLLRAFEYYEASVISYLGLVRGIRESGRTKEYYELMNRKRYDLVNQFEKDPVLVHPLRFDKRNYKDLLGKGNRQKLTPGNPASAKKRKMKILHVVGARPNFMKAAPVMAALAHKNGAQQKLLHTGQHYDTNMSEVFFRQLGLPEPDINLEVGSESQAVQTANVMVRLERILLDDKPDLVLVYGDVNSTLAAALVCAKQLIPVGHVEAGLRSFDRNMPEEINRVLTDQIVDLLFTPSKDGDENLLREGVPKEKIHLVGNVMIDTLLRLLPRAEIKEFRDLGIRELVKNGESYALATLHRPSNVDDPKNLSEIITTLNGISRRLPVIFPVHPRTHRRILDFGLRISENGELNLVDPLSYLDFLALQKNATVVITDSGGIQEETTFLGVPCLTVRKNTERPITVEIGTNIVVGQDMERLKTEVYRILDGNSKKGSVPPLWDGRAGERIAKIIVDWGNNRK